MREMEDGLVKLIKEGKNTIGDFFLEGVGSRKEVRTHLRI
jgi:hypothetical protein